MVWAISGHTQELPPVINFDQNQYKAGNQNWMISQGSDKNIYVANSRGLLEFTGSEWNLFSIPNQSIVRSVVVASGKIFTGAYMEFGFWEKDETGYLEYTSLIDHFPNGLKDGEQFWHINHIDNFVITQSFEGVYLYNLRSAEITQISTPEGIIRNLFRIDNTVYFQIDGYGLYSIRNNAAQPVIPSQFLEGEEIMHVYKNAGNLRLITRKGKFLEWENGEMTSIYPQLEEKIKNRSVYSAITLSDNSLVLGTVENGIYHVNFNGDVIYHFNQQNGLINNTVLWLYNDLSGNIWAGLDNGLSIINLNSRFRLFQDNYGSIGSVYASLLIEDMIYLGTNQGLFFRKEGEEKFTFIEGTNGQVWSLQQLDGNIFMGHNNGTYLIKGNTASRIFARSGTWTIRNYKNCPNVYIQGHYDGLSLIRKEEEGFTYLGMIPEFPHSSKFVISEPNGEIWVGNEHKGVFKIELKEEGTSISNLKNYTFESVSGITSSIFKFNDTLYYSAKDQLFQYRTDKDEFIKESTLAGIFEENDMISGKIVNSSASSIWGFSNHALFNVETVPLGARYRVNSVYLPNDLKNITLGYENISGVNDEFLLGVSNGYLRFDKYFEHDSNHQIRIDRIFLSALDQVPVRAGLDGTSPLHYKTNNINIRYSIAEYNKFFSPLYSYRLAGLTTNWSPWTSATFATFENLSFGAYSFEVRAKIGDDLISPVSYSFEIARPWYFSYLAITIYIILFVIILVIVNNLYKLKHRRLIEENEKELKLKNLEAENIIIELQNEQLEKDMANKNKELAISTMNLIKKNEFLTNIKEKLKQSNDSSEVRSVIKTIDKDISEEDNWNFFREAFNNADRDFFKKIKASHPNLSSNDLKLCAYLRLNLSSKDIAPLLNISIKSVEIKRYRLRKKMNLPHEMNLTDYIMEI